LYFNISITSQELQTSRLVSPRLKILTSRLGWWSQRLERWASRSRTFTSRAYPWFLLNCIYTDQGPHLANLHRYSQPCQISCQWMWPIADHITHVH